MRSRLCILIALLLPAAIVPARAETVLRARLNADILSSDPGMRRDENTDAVLLHVVEGLVAYRADGSVGPMLASGWTVSPDGRTYRFALRRGIRFHNGEPLTAGAVKWSLDRYFAPDSGWRCKSAFGANGIARVLSVAAPDPDTVVVTLDRAAPLFLKTLARTDCGETGIVARASVGRDGVWRFPIGTGPFRWGVWRRNQYIDLVRFPGYRPLPGPPDGNCGGKRALVDRVRFSIIPDGSAASAALLRGSLDVLDELAPNELGNVRGVPGINVLSAPTSDFFALLFQARNPLIHDARLRRAIALAIDDAALARVVGHGAAVANSSPIPVTSPFHGRVEAPLIGQNLPLARRLVKASGYRGQEIQLITNRRYPQGFDSAILIQAMARSVGINMRIVTLDWATQLARYESGDYQAMVFPFSARLDPSFILDTLIGDGRADPHKVWYSPQARALLKQSIETGPAAARQAIFDRLDRLFRREVPAVILFNDVRETAVRSDVDGFRVWPGGLQRLWNVGLKGRR